MKADSAKKLGAVDAVFALHMRGDLPDEAFQPTLEAAIGGSDPVAAALRWKALAKPATAAKAPKEQSRVWQLNQKKGVLSDALVRGYRALKNADKIEDPDEQQTYRAQLQEHIDGLEEQLAAVGEEIIGSVNQAGGGGGPAPIAPRLALPTRQSGPIGPPAPKAPEGPGWFSRQLQGLGSMFGGGATEDQTTPSFIPMRPFSTDKLQVFNSLQDEDLEFIGQLPAFISLQEDREGWLVVHAGLEPGKELKDQDMGKMTHIRFLHQETRKTVSLDDNHQPPAGSVYWTEMYDLPYSVVYGHTVHSFTKPEVTKKAHGPTLVGLDTGACFGGRLSAFFIPEHGEKVGPEHFVQVQASKAYSRSLLQNVKWDE
jgi:hypothetical protein